MREAILYHADEAGTVVCDLCAHRCRLESDAIGLCGVRENTNGILHTLSDDRILSANVEPIEAIPFFHVLPGTRTLAIAGLGENFRCRFCRTTSPGRLPRARRGTVPGMRASGRTIVDRAVRSECASITFTHTEPTVHMELVLEAARLAKDKGLRCFLMTNGYMTPEAVETIAPLLSAVCVELKGGDEEMHRRLWGASVEPVLDTIRRFSKRGIWVEALTLVVPGITDSVTELAEIATFLVGVDRDTPWHLGAHPSSWRETALDPSERFLLEHAIEIGRQAGLHNVYCACVDEPPKGSTYCPSCGTRIVERFRREVLRVSLDHGRCTFCRARTRGMWGDALPWPERRTEATFAWAGAERRREPELR